MSRTIKLFISLLLALLLCSLPVATAFAAGSSVTLQAAVSLTGTLPANADTFSVILKDIATGKESVGTVTGAGIVTFDPLTFEQVGVYQYTVEQAAGTNTACRYDSTVYRVTVSVCETGTGLATGVAVYKTGSDLKQSEIRFTNTYPTETTTTTTTTTSATTTTPASTEQTTAADNRPDTGDMTNAPAWAAVFVLGFLLMIGAAVILLPRKREEE